ncbi:MAG: SDR family NAD(P)-dependent oxidoreductase [Bacteroidales bacterium]|nr:SDR family NAD(P)-dependent oxidoreductase [Bacteroidales bacterium]
MTAPTQYFKHKIIWITGASSGIGKQIAVTLSSIEDVSLILSARRVEKLTEVAEECKQNGAKCAVFPLDLENTAILENKTNEALQLFGRIDIVVHNGGISQRSLAYETPIENDRKIMEIDYFSSIIITKTLLPYMMNNGFGHIVVTSSISGCFGFPQRSAYCAAKHALYGYYEALDIEMRSKNVAVTIVSPGRINTPISLSALTKEGKAHGEMDPGQAKGLDAHICAKRIIKGVAKKKHEILVGKGELIMVHIYRKFPRLFHLIATKINPT